MAGLQAHLVPVPVPLVHQTQIQVILIQINLRMIRPVIHQVARAPRGLLVPLVHLLIRHMAAGIAVMVVNRKRESILVSRY